MVIYPYIDLNMQSIEFYTDYRQFLQDYYNWKKESSRYFSYRQFTIKAGLNSPSIYREVVAGKRNLTIQTIASFIKGLGLNERDGRFFENLVLFNQAKSEESKKKYLSVLRGLRYRKPQKQIPVHLYEYYEKWYNPVIRELAVSLDWKEDYPLLARSVSPAIKASQARESVELLIRLGFLKKIIDQLERRKPELLNGSRRTRIANGSVTSPIAPIRSGRVLPLPGIVVIRSARCARPAGRADGTSTRGT